MDFSFFGAFKTDVVMPNIVGLYREVRMIFNYDYRNFCSDLSVKSSCFLGGLGNKSGIIPSESFNLLTGGRPSGPLFFFFFFLVAI